MEPSPNTVLLRPSQTQDFSKQITNFITRWTRGKSLLHLLAGGASQLGPFAVEEAGIWTLPPQVGEEEARHTLWLLLSMVAAYQQILPSAQLWWKKCTVVGLMLVNDVVLAGAQDFVGAASSHGWMQLSERCLWEG